MRIIVYLPLLLAVVIAWPAPRIARLLAPAVAVRWLALVAALTSAATTWVLGLLAASLVRDAPPVVEFVHAHDVTMRRIVPTAVAALAVLCVAVGLVRVAVLAYRRSSGLAAVRRVLAGSGAATDLLISRTDTPYAFAVPGRPGRIVISTGLLGLLDAAERRAVLAHEAAHLRHDHVRYQLLADLAVALNPLLGGVRTALAFHLERWADEEAAVAVGSREVVARSIARVALACRAAPPTGLSAVTFAAARLGIRHRVLALGRAPLPPRRPIAMFALFPAVTALLFAADATVAFLRWAAVLAPLAL